MPDPNVQLILDRVFADDDFRRRLEADLEGTVLGLGIALSDAALAELMTVLDEGGDFAVGLDQRLSQSGFALNPAALLRQKAATGKRTEDFDQRSAAVKVSTARHGGSNRQRQAPAVAGEPAAMPAEPLEEGEMDIEVESD
ncbi:MAG: hypothetical protein MUF78_01490 [Candidatus Edwardsbacteria bacterium]|jgi:hypothetical protein|nr:hypothetical protein [Candidatus Edwardsbacteria bacterium]